MAQELINLGAVANDRTGDDWRTGGQKINDNFSQLFSDSAIYINQESDFPTQDATTITLEAGQSYIFSGSFSVSKNFICQEGSLVDGRNGFSSIVTFTGSGIMFSGVDASFFMRNVMLIPGITNSAFSFTDTVGGIRRVIFENMIVNNAAKLGNFTDMRVVEFLNFAAHNVNDGASFFGTSGTILLCDRINFTSTSASFKAIDLGTATQILLEFNTMIVNAPAGAFGISGLTSSGNVPAGSLARVENCTFVSGVTPLETITADDIRWSFKNNTGIKDTFADALTAFRSNATETVIATQDVPVIINATWVEEQVSQFSTTTAGRATYLAERDLQVPITASAGLISSGGGAINVSMSLALNGTVISTSSVQIAISGSSAQTLSIPWQITMSEDDYVEVFVENNTNTTNIIVEYATLRLR